MSNKRMSQSRALRSYNSFWKRTVPSYRSSEHSSDHYSDNHYPSDHFSDNHYPSDLYSDNHYPSDHYSDNHYPSDQYSDDHYSSYHKEEVNFHTKRIKLYLYIREI